MATKNMSLPELIMAHLPKNYKYYLELKNEDDYKILEDEKFDMALLDTINDAELITAAKQKPYKFCERDVVAHAKEPTVLERGVILSKKMATKTDKKLIQVGYAFFEHADVSYVSVLLCYERFDIYEIFILT